MSKTKVSQETVRRSARSAGLLGAALLGLGLLAVPGSAGANRVTLGREHIQQAVERLAQHLNARRDNPGLEFRKSGRPSGGPMDHVVFPAEVMVRIFPVLAGQGVGGAHSGTGRAPAQEAGAHAEDVAPTRAVLAVEAHATRVLDGMQRFLAYELSDWGVRYRGSPGEDGSPGELLTDRAHDDANFLAAGGVLAAMAPAERAKWTLRVVRAQAHARWPNEQNWAAAMLPDNGDKPPIEDRILNAEMLNSLGSLRDLSVTPPGLGSVRALSLLLPDNAELPPPASRAAAKPGNGGRGLVGPGGNFVWGGPSVDERHFFDITE